MATQFTAFLDLLVKAKSTLNDNHFKEFKTEFGITEKNTHHGFTNYVSIDIPNFAFNILKKTKDIIPLKEYSNFKLHNIYTIDMVNIGHRVAKNKPVKYDNTTYIDPVVLCHKLFVLYYNNYVLGNETYVMSIHSILLALCLGVYEFDKYHTFAEEFAVSDLTNYDTEHKIIRTLGRYYENTGNLRYAHMINLILRSDAYNVRYTIKDLERYYKKYDYIGKFETIFDRTSLVPELARVNVAGYDEQLDDAYQIIAESFPVVFNYTSVLNGCDGKIKNHEIDLDILHSLIMDISNKADNELMKTIHLSILKRLIKLRYTEVDKDYNSVYIN